MKRTLNLCCWLFSLALLLLLTACDGGGGGGASSSVTSGESGTSQSSATTLSGTVADGYLRGARVFLDRNGNRMYDSGEPMAMSATGGTFTLSINPGEGSRHSVVVEVIGGETIDEDDIENTVVNSYLLEAPPGRWQFISPLTTLVNLEIQKNRTLTLEGAELKVKDRLFGYVPEISLFSDYIALQSDNLRTEEAKRTHNVAQVVAALMGRLQSEVVANLAGEVMADQQRLIAYLISDEILRYGEMVGEALNQDRDSDSAANVLNIMSEMDTEGLNRDSLVLYAQRIAQNPEVWDMDPPRIVQQNILSGAEVSVDYQVTVVFDKEIDQSTISANSISLRRSGAYVSGVVDYDATSKRLSFSPSQMLFPHSDYEVIVSGQLADHLGNRIGKDLTWQFKTLFGLTPPPLAEIGLEQ